MTDPKKLADDVAVCAFVPPERIAELAPRFATIINNRLDYEEPGQPTSAQIEAEARRLGLEYVHIPVIPGQINEEQVAAFGQAMSNRRGPLLAFCKSGRRATTLWALSQAGRQSTDQILSAAAAAGHDLTALRPILEEKAAHA